MAAVTPIIMEQFSPSNLMGYLDPFLYWTNIDERIAINSPVPRRTINQGGAYIFYKSVRVVLRHALGKFRAN